MQDITLPDFEAEPRRRSIPYGQFHRRTRAEDEQKIVPETDP